MKRGSDGGTGLSGTGGTGTDGWACWIVVRCTGAGARGEGVGKVRRG